RNIEKALGKEDKHVTSSERKNIAIARKSIIAAIKINIGDLFTEQNLTVKRPGTGVSPMLWDSVIGQVSKKSYQPDDLIEL
ncbi:MAG: N-acetylneuraminate synthase, partial [Bacteroidales bacterium]|nr:N-acetylneuraminate synthase [Bacteroidales bacterium]